jgi:DegV family protein with EDD domain
VNIIPLDIFINGKIHPEADTLKAADLPITTRRGYIPRAQAPSIKHFEETFIRLGVRYSEIVCILHSKHLSRTVDNARQAAASVQGRISIEVIDTSTTALGLGLLIQTAAEAAEANTSAVEIEHMLRGLLPRIYTSFCIEGLTYLQQRNYLSHSQALIGEYLKVLPVFTMEGGQLVPTQKARNYRHLVDILHEFLWEFTELEHIAILQGAPPFENETRTLRERIALDFSDTPISEHIISATLAAMIGPRSLGLFVLQRTQ